MQPIVTAVAWSVCLCACLLVTSVGPANTAEPIVVSFAVWSRVGPRVGYLARARTPQGKGQFWGSDLGMRTPHAVDSLNRIC